MPDRVANQRIRGAGVRIADRRTVEHDRSHGRTVLPAAAAATAATAAFSALLRSALPRSTLAGFFFALGLLGLYIGLLATDSLGEKIKEGFTGWYTERTTWYLVGGTVALLVGGTLAFSQCRGTHA